MKETITRLYIKRKKKCINERNHHQEYLQIESSKRPTKETNKRDESKRPTKQTYKRDQQKRPQKRPTKETYQ